MIGPAAVGGTSKRRGNYNYRRARREEAVVFFTQSENTRAARGKQHGCYFTWGEFTFFYCLVELIPALFCSSVRRTPRVGVRGVQTEAEWITSRLCFKVQRYIRPLWDLFTVRTDPDFKSW